jgi:hypothetical protein
MAMGDLDGDGKNEVVLIDERNLSIYRWENEFKLVKKLSGGKLNQYLAVDAGDIDKDGKAEIFVTSLEGDATETSTRKLSSFVVAFRGGLLGHRQKSSLVLRVVDWGEKGAFCGQKRGTISPTNAYLRDGMGRRAIRRANRRLQGLQPVRIHSFLS